MLSLTHRIEIEKLKVSQHHTYNSFLIYFLTYQSFWLGDVHEVSTRTTYVVANQVGPLHSEFLQGADSSIVLGTLMVEWH